MRATMGQARKIAQRELDTVKATLTRLFPEKVGELPQATSYICDVLAEYSASRVCDDLELAKLVAGSMLSTFGSVAAIVEWSAREVPPHREEWTEIVMLRMLNEKVVAA